MTLLLAAACLQSCVVMHGSGCLACSVAAALLPGHVAPVLSCINAILTLGMQVAFRALEQGLVDRAVLPIENSLGGSIHPVYDLLIR